MCTVSFLPSHDRIWLTSNRDEHVLRAPASLPEVHEYASGKLLYPVDGKAGGTWVALHSNGNAMILLNGAYRRHVPQYPYRQSRGLVFLKIFDSADPKTAFEQVLLQDTEPFTLVIWHDGKLWEARWDGSDKYVMPCAVNLPHIWSSVTLYDEEVRAKRREWFAAWQKKHPHPATEDLLHFHEFAGEGDEYNSLRMNRDGKLLTVSITCIEIMKDNATMHYKDLNAGLFSVNKWRMPGNLKTI